MFKKINISIFIVSIFLLLSTFEYANSNIIVNNNNETILHGDTVLVSWITDYFEKDSIIVEIYNAETQTKTTLETNIADSLGYYEWVVPSSITAGNYYSMKVTIPHDSLYLINDGFLAIQAPTPKKAEYKEQKTIANNITIYPIPATDFLTIKSDIRIREYAIIDILGNSVFSGTMHENIDVSGLQSGVYFIKLTIQNNDVIHKKFIVE